MARSARPTGDAAVVSAIRSAPTVTDVARHAGVSPMTVSRVLSGGKNVRPELRARVERSVAELGYRRNQTARGLRQRQTGLVGVIVTNLGNPYYAAVLDGIEELVGASGRRVLVGTSDEDPDRERALIDDFIGRQADGLIVVPTGGAGKHLEEAHRTGLPVVLASRSQDGVRADTVLVDDIQGARRVTETLLAEGHRRIAFVGNAVSVFTGQRRLEGFVRAHSDAGIPVLPELVRQGQQDIRSAEEAARELMELPEPPTAIFGANNRNMVGVLRALSSAGAFRAGAPVPPRLAGFDDFDLVDLVPTTISIVEHDAAELGRSAAELLLARLDGDRRDRSPRTIELPTRIRTRTPD